ncbi:hypothetical protein [Pseudomonas putida]
MSKGIDIIVVSDTGTSPSLLRVTEQDWREDGFEIEAVAEERPPYYHIRLTGRRGPEPGGFMLESEEDENGHVQVEFGIYEEELALVDEGDFLLTNINYHSSSLAGEFSFSCELEGERVTVNCWSFEIPPAT